ncbi:MAG: NB-ARC domain-containing protein [Chloroflexota bacterium]|nr:NB-ARC domain-containing protein [Chloroflexota bacterium]
MSASSSLTIFPQRPTAARLGHAAPLTPIPGREAEIEQVVRLLDRDDLRVVTLLGPGGVGKTRLAQEVTTLVRPDFAHDACFVALASIRDPDLVPKAVAQTLGIQESVDRSAADALVDVLADRHLLLVLDNLEQVIAAAPWLAELLAQCPRLRVLVTSRISLNIAGEQRFVVPPLAVPRSSNDALNQFAAVELFVQRAQAVDITFGLTAKTPPPWRRFFAVSMVCRSRSSLRRRALKCSRRRRSSRVSPIV